MAVNGTCIRNALCRRMLQVLLVMTAIWSVGGCASYTTPGGAADFRAMGITTEQADSLTDAGILDRLQRQPLAGFPASIAIARVQECGYRSCTAEGWGVGRFSIVTTRDVESDESFARLEKLPMIAGLAPLNRLVVGQRLDCERDLRAGAASVQADMLLLYTFDTRFGAESKIPPLGVITLGLFPETEARVISTASAVLIDTRNGYVYGLAEGTSRTTQLANAWTSGAAVDESRRRAECEAFDKLVEQLELTWRGVVARYGPHSPTDVAAGAR